MNVPARLIFALALCLHLAGCEEEEEEPIVADPASAPIQLSVPFDSATVRLVSDGDTVPVTVEIAETDQQRSVGLMKRTALSPDAGMLFIFEAEQPADGVFWMFNTLIPLDIAFIGGDGRIASIRQMEPCTSPYPQWCPNYASGAPFLWALEMNSGFFASKDLAVGDLVLVDR